MLHLSDFCGTGGNEERTDFLIREPGFLYCLLFCETRCYFHRSQYGCTVLQELRKPDLYEAKHSGTCRRKERFFYLISHQLLVNYETDYFSSKGNLINFIKSKL